MSSTWEISCRIYCAVFASPHGGVFAVASDNGGLFGFIGGTPERGELPMAYQVVGLKSNHARFCKLFKTISKKNSFILAPGLQWAALMSRRVG
jgi:hypothetical protein